MELKPKYEIGEKVFKGDYSRPNLKIECPDCLGTAEWTVTTPAKEVFQTRCHTCNEGWYSSGKVANYVWSSNVTELTIGSIRMDSQAKDGEKFSYMCEETGVGSGTIHYEKSLFKDKGEAQEYGRMLAEKIGKERSEEFEERRQLDKEKSFCYRK